MLRKVLVSILVSFVFLLGKTVSGIYGYVISDTFWQDTVEVVGDVMVEEGATLIIKPGTVVKFLADTSVWDDTAGYGNRCDITVYGNLKLRGTSADSITFTSTEDSAGSWGGIRYLSTSRDTLEYVQLNYGIRALVFDSALNVSIQHCRIWAFSGQHLELGEGGELTGIGILLRGDSASIKSSVISSVSGGVGDVPYDFYIGGDAYGIFCDSCLFLEISYDTITHIHGAPSKGSDGGFPYRGGDGIGIEVRKGESIFIAESFLKGCGGGDGPERGFGSSINILKGFATIEANLITKNQNGIFLLSSGIIGGKLSQANDLYENTNCNAFCEYSDSVDARYNYWGTIDEIEILNKLSNISKYSPWTDSLHEHLYYPSGIFGEITKDTIWKNEVKIRGDIVVSEGVTLQIDPGTKVKFTPYSFWEEENATNEKCDIIVYGKLEAVGSLTDSIIFGDQSTKWGCIIFYEDTDDTLRFCQLIRGGIFCDNASPYIESNRIWSGCISLYYASPYIIGNKIGGWINCGEGSSPNIAENFIDTGAREWLENAPLIRSSTYGIFVSPSSFPTVRDNRITAIDEDDGARVYGIYCSSSCLIEGNTIFDIIGGIYEGEEIGIYVGNSGEVIIKGNTISVPWGKNILCAGNSCPHIFSNNIEIDYGIGITCTDNSNPLIGGNPEHQNSFILPRNTSSHSGYLIKNYTPDTIIATHNYWGTTDKDSISMFIFDHNDDPQYGYVIFEPFITDTTERDTSEADTTKPLPDSFAFYSPSPNPFIRICNISYSLPEPVSVDIGVFDIAGRKVWSLFEPELEKGNYQVHWSGRDKRGRRLPIGVYFIRFKAEDYSETRKVVLLR